MTITFANIDLFLFPHWLRNRFIYNTVELIQVQKR